MKKMIAWGFNKIGQAIKLNPSATILSSRYAIVHHYRQNFGVGPMALLKQIRLAQGSPAVQRTIGGHAVQEIASHFGFQSCNHFARD